MGMRFVRTDSGDAVVEATTKAIQSALEAGQWVIWLVSGGSLVPLQVTIMKRLTGSDLDLANLAIFQADERYGDDGHADSNWQKLFDAGFETGNAYTVPVLAGLSLAETAARYDRLVSAAFGAPAAVVVGLFGIGTDGHTAGILPDSAAAQPTIHLVTGYEGPDFKRITLTPVALAKVDIALAYAASPDKAAPLKRLYETDAAPAQQPAQFLKTASDSVVYNDILEGSL